MTVIMCFNTLHIKALVGKLLKVKSGERVGRELTGDF
jgi:hypothetical protein